MNIDFHFIKSFISESEKRKAGEPRLKNLDHDKERKDDSNLDKALITLCFITFVALGYFLILYLRI